MLGLHNQRINSWTKQQQCVPLIRMIVVSFLMASVAVVASVGREQVSTKTKLTHYRLQQRRETELRRRQQQRYRTSSSNTNGKQNKQQQQQRVKRKHGSFVTWFTPSRDRVSEWFGCSTAASAAAGSFDHGLENFSVLKACSYNINNHNNNKKKKKKLSASSSQSSLFNHNCVGMTNPCLHISPSRRGSRQWRSVHPLILLSSSSSAAAAAAETSVTKTEELSRPVVPAGGGSMPQQQLMSSSKSTTAGFVKHFQFWKAQLPFRHNNNNNNLHPSERSLQLLQTIDATVTTATRISDDQAFRRMAASPAADVDHCWWPETAVTSSSSRSSPWRVIRMRRRIGSGMACYQRVRDAALEWEFQSAGGGNKGSSIKNNNQHPAPKCGMIRVVSCRQQQQFTEERGQRYSVHRFLFNDDNDNNNNSMQQSSYHSLWSGPGGKQFVTYTRAASMGRMTSLLSWCVRHFTVEWIHGLAQSSVLSIYNVNPVALVYDWVDQRGPATTFTSTAYATCAGHWLRGEERVTVALRDDHEQSILLYGGDSSGGAGEATSSGGGGPYVDVELVSFSRPSPGFFGTCLVWPIMSLGGMQQRFFQQQLDALEKVAAAALPTPAAPTKPTSQHSP